MALHKCFFIKDYVEPVNYVIASQVFIKKGHHADDLFSIS